ncbi:MAG: stage II sporulation protein R [Lachnospiraceae bacterium]|nr:stage II sporulation protein R [Lachnospiraceae bacterium]
MNIKKINILKPQILFLVFVYSMSFALLLIGLKLFNLETKAASYRNTSPDTVFEGESVKEIQKNIASNIIRLHVIANSDSKEDQQLKLKVRDGILDEVKSCVQNAASVKQAENAILSQKDRIASSAENIIKSEGYDYKVNIALKDRYFPVKSYGDLVFPAGIYNALCIEIGDANGRNWWCVLFPSLCLVDETKAVVPDESKEKLKKNLTKSEYDILEQSDAVNTEFPNDKSNGKENTKNEKMKFECHSAIYDWFVQHMD